ncbi:hypothetical protein DFA_09978 [Cavenderia fasciculata]|uniref:MRH domain-containing protein n=1 Tax=Cavenderia fasciculata TaxID=261658 RepID=F4Q8Y5_CACFS|nr:uncharacterized protein DFA_09978 [Cavenderia fasciculata]EGG15154.1 hypothetical protein DFA_09978 [Cavenderia fasciculata]|eukprot:XP_004351874.1 hypothetical protein DFA_09978 [Cavenderia fasciculata]
MMYYYYFVLAFISSHFISGAFGTAPNCEYNGIDYSGFNVQGTNYIWSVCQPNLQCNSLLGATNIVSCQKPTTGTPQNTGLLSSGVWADSPGGGGAVVNYKSGTAPCKSSGKVRQTNVFFTCAPGQPDKVVAADESATKCVYEVFMSGQSACASSSSSSSSDEEGVVNCSFSHDTLSISNSNDNQFINCTSTGVTSCASPGSMCGTQNNIGQIYCLSTVKMQCTSLSVSCVSGNVTCSLVNGAFNMN